MSTEIALPDEGYELEITPLSRGGRADVYIPSQGNHKPPDAFTSTDIVGQLRVFFDRIDAEAEAQKDNPIALVNALARMDALLADVRAVRDAIRNHTAEALASSRIRRLTIEDVATVEGTAESNRTDWQDAPLFAAMWQLEGLGDVINRQSGEILSAEQVADLVLQWFRVQWRMTPIRDAGLDIDSYSTQPKDEDGKPLRTPSIRIHDNVMRKEGVTR